MGAPPVFFVEPADLQGAGPVVLTGPEGRHAARVRRMRVGERIDVADGAGVLVQGVVVATGPDSVTLRAERRLVCAAPQPRITVVQALPKGERGELCVELMTELGVDAIVPWTAARCVTRWQGERGERAAQRWRAHAHAAAKQARRAWVPQIAGATDTAAVAGLVAEADLAVVLEAGGAQPLAALSPPEAGEVIVVVGPEGGLEPAELASLQAAGARVCRLGPEVVRTSTAGAAALAVLSSRSRRWV